MIVNVGVSQQKKEQKKNLSLCPIIYKDKFFLNYKKSRSHSPSPLLKEVIAQVTTSFLLYYVGMWLSCLWWQGIWPNSWFMPESKNEKRRIRIRDKSPVQPWVFHFYQKDNSLTTNPILYNCAYILSHRTNLQRHHKC